MIHDLADVKEGEAFGGKAVALGAAVRAGLPVPGGVALSADGVEAVCAADPAALVALRAACRPGTCYAVRSSAAGEDSEAASFAGAHDTVLGVRGVEEVVAAVAAVRASAAREGALAYRSRMRLAPALRMGVVVQELVDADVAGVMFTRNPVTGAVERVIEASWGLGVSVVEGLVIPDRFRLAPGGALLQRCLGDKDVALHRVAGGTREYPVPADRAVAPCLGGAELAALDRLASACDAAFCATGHDIEFAIRDGALYLLQRRPITGG